MRVAITERGQEVGEIDLGKSVSFLKRQFTSETTRKQRIFDWVFGVILPVICVAADPIVFRSSRAMLYEYKPFAYALSFISIMALMAFMLFGKKLGRFNAALSGLFAFGTLVCLVVGTFLLPFSLIGLLFLIGVLGFTPLFAAFVYGRSAVRAFKLVQLSMNKGLLVKIVLLSALFSFTLPWVLNAQFGEAWHGPMRTLYLRIK